MSSQNGSQFPKSPDSQCVINLLIPRRFWNDFQRPRTQSTPDQRCGPHISFVDPFVQVSHYREAAALLEHALRDFPPFLVHLNEFGHFTFARSATAFIVPRTDPPDAIERLSQRLLEVFPQCNDLLKRTGKLVPHISLAKFKNEKDCLDWIAKAQHDIPPSSSFLLSEIYLLHRIGGDPFKVIHTVPLGSNLSIEHLPPEFGKDSLPASHPLLRTLMLGGLPKFFSPALIPDLLRLCKLDEASEYELLRNPDGKTRGILLIAFPTTAQAIAALDSFESQPDSSSLGPSCPLELVKIAQTSSLYVVPMELMAYPDEIGGTCYPIIPQSRLEAIAQSTGKSKAKQSSSSSSSFPSSSDSSSLPFAQSSLRWDHTSALIVEIDQSLHSSIQSVRSSFDKAFDRWMPHINILYPFLLDDASLDGYIPLIAEAISRIPSFTVQFSRLNFFKAGKTTKTVHLVGDSIPEDALDALFKALLALFPSYIKDTNGRIQFKPHMTIGQWPIRKPLSEIAELVPFIKDTVSFEVTNITMISRSQSDPSQPFGIRHRFPLGPKSSP